VGYCTYNVQGECVLMGGARSQCQWRRTIDHGRNMLTCETGESGVCGGPAYDVNKFSPSYCNYLSIIFPFDRLFRLLPLFLQIGVGKSWPFSADRSSCLGRRRSGISGSHGGDFIELPLLLGATDGHGLRPYKP
jgi:hypothetical protein